MSFDWPTTKLQNVVKLHTGFPFKSNEYSTDGAGYPLLRGDNIVQGFFRWEDVKRWPISNLTSKHNNYFLEEGDIVLAMDRPWIEAGLKFAQVSQGDLPCLLVQRVSCIRASTQVDQNFLRYLIASYSFVEYIKQVQTGTAVPHISGKQILDFEFKLPPYSIQKNIGSTLRNLDDKILHNKKINQTIEQMAQALFKSWFVDFEPVKAKMAVLEAGGSQEEATLAAMTAISGKDADALAVFEREHPEQYAELKATAELFPSAMQEGELGATPTGWKLGCIGDISHRIRTKVGSTSAVVLSAIASGDLVPSDEHFTKQVYSKSIEKYILVEQWSFAYNPSRINIGSIGLNVRNVNGAVSPVYVVFKTEQEYKWYVEILTKTTYFKNNVNILASGSVRQSLSYDDLSSIPLCIPDVSIVNVFNEKYEVYLTFIEQYRNQNNTLISIRDTLLPKLLSGEITLPEAEQAVSEAENV